MLTADRAIALGLIGLSVYFMAYAIDLPIGWEGETGGPGGGAFPFWLSLVMAGCAVGILLRPTDDDAGPFFDPDTLRSVIAVSVALLATIAMIPFAGAYIAIILFLLWYLRVFGGHGWTLTLCLTVATPIFFFFFFEVTLKILLPKGWTEPLFLPLYAMFF